MSEQCVLCGASLEEDESEFVCDTCGVLNEESEAQVLHMLLPTPTLTMREWLTSVLFNPLLPSVRSFSFVQLDVQPELSDLTDLMLSFDAEQPTSAALEDLLVSCEASGSCAVCLDDMSGACVRLPCEHSFHRACVELWLSNHDTCPICRDSLMQRALHALF